jgi:Asp-tRNA(Asn)/Glu-tRNA(Gln) amidotransferase A subunit family amidase
MVDDSLCILPISDLVVGYRSRQFSPIEVTDAYIRRIERLNGTLRAYISVFAEDARTEARAAMESLLKNDDRGNLHGVPLGLKDVIDCAGLPTTAGAPFRQTHRAVQDAQVVRNLRKAGAVILGKHNLLEFAMGGTDRNPHFGVTPNPWNVQRFTGGSSSGTAAAVTAGLAAAGLGSDTGGSIRQPAAYCGITGLKPTHGLVSMLGVFPVASSADTVGPMTHSVADAALVLQDITSHDKQGPNSSPASTDYVSALTRHPLDTFRVGVDRSWVEQGADRDVVVAWEEALEVLSDAGVSVDDVTIPEPKDLGAMYRDVVAYEAFQTHCASLDLHADRYSAATRTRLEEGRRVPVHNYRRALEATRVLRSKVDELPSVVHVLLLPTQPTVAPHLGSQVAMLNGAETSVLPIRGRFAHLASLTGLPSLSIPAGFSNEGLPVGVQLVGRGLGEPTLLRLGHAYQQATDWHLRRPTVPDTTQT